MLDFTMMSENDLYNADQVTNENFEYLAQNVLPSSKITKAGFDALVVKDPDRVYLVIDNGKVYPYLGDIPFAGGVSRTGTPTALTDGTNISNTGVATYHQFLALTNDNEAEQEEM